MKKQTPWGWPDGAPTTYRPIVLEEIVFRYSRAFAIPPRVVLDDMTLRDIERWVIHVYQSVMGEQLGTKTVSHPANWREACKAALYAWLGGGVDTPEGHWPWAGDVCRRRWPVRQTVHTFEAAVLYPDIALPDQRHAYFMRELPRHEDDHGP